MDDDFEDPDDRLFPLRVYRLEGELVIPAAAVTDMLPGIADTWGAWRGSGRHRLDPETTAVLRTALENFADQLEVE